MRCRCPKGKVEPSAARRTGAMRVRHPTHRHGRVAARNARWTYVRTLRQRPALTRHCALRTARNSMRRTPGHGLRSHEVLSIRRGATRRGERGRVRLCDRKGIRGSARQRTPRLIYPACVYAETHPPPRVRQRRHFNLRSIFIKRYRVAALEPCAALADVRRLRRRRRVGVRRRRRWTSCWGSRARRRNTVVVVG